VAGLSDLCHVDEVGFSPTLPTNYSWSGRGQRIIVAYEAPQGRRVNALGAYFTHGPAAGTLLTQTWARVPPRRAKKPRKTAAEVAAAHGLGEEELGVLDSARFIAFIWMVAGRPAGAAADWVRERPLEIILDNYSVHTSGAVRAMREEWKAAGIQLRYLPAYSPELSAIEPVWNTVKQHELPTRSFRVLGDLKRAVDEAFARKAAALQQAAAESTSFVRAST
jgi:DDE superfamily endonuclease